MFAKHLEHDAHTRRYVIRQTETRGWEVLTEEDGLVQRRVLYDDWHRVEHARRRFDAEISRLEDAGWHERPS